MRRIPAFLPIVLILATSAGAGTVPLPPPRPALPWDAPTPRLVAVPLPPPRPPIELAPRLQGEFVAAALPAEGACTELLAEGIVVAESGEIRNASEECGGPPLLRLSAVISAEGKAVELRPAAVLRCEIARELAHWVREDLAPAAKTMLGSPIVSIHVAASYFCRSRNNVSGAPLSEHARANALDIRALGLSDGRTLAIAAPDTPEFIVAVRRSACARFMTVLGPGADPAHELHLHIDLAQRRNLYRMCQWREPKLAGP
jgi:hypothetical protein